MNTKKKGTAVRTTLRMPKNLHRKIIAFQRNNPEMSINSIIVEAVRQDMEKKTNDK